MSNSINPVFVKFNAIDGKTTVTFGGEEQKGAEILNLLAANEGAKAGYGIGYAGTPVAVNIKWDGPDIPFNTPYADVPWGRAALCSAVKTAAVGDDPASIALTELDATNIHGTCFGTTVQDSSIQLNCAFSVGAGAGPVASSDASGLFIAVFANASIGEDDTLVIGEGETVVALSEAIDPTVLNVAEGENLQFVLPAATGGYTFTARGTMVRAPFVHRVGNYTSLNDQVTSYPTSQAILDAKISE